MSDSKLATNIIKLVNNSAKLTGKLQNGINVILWGSANTKTNQTVKYDTVSGSLKYVSNPTTAVPPKGGNLVESGLFNALDILNEVDLCSIATYLTDNIHTKKNKRPEKPWKGPNAALYTIQEQAEFVQGYIDKFFAFPNVFIGSYIGGPVNGNPPVAPSAIQTPVQSSNQPATTTSTSTSTATATTSTTSAVNSYPSPQIETITVNGVVYRQGDPGYEGAKKDFAQAMQEANQIKQEVSSQTNTNNTNQGGTGITVTTPQQAISQSNAPIEGGSRVTAYNVYFLMQAVKDTFSFSNNTSSSLFTVEDKTLLSTVPGLGSNLNIVDDFIGTINKYSDYRQIPDVEVQRLIKKITTLRSVCVAIQNLDFKNGLAAVGNFLQTDIRAQIQKLNKFLDPTIIIPTLKAINNSLRSFLRIAKQVQGILSLGQFLIKLALVFNKVFVFIKTIFDSNPLPLVYSVSGVQTRLQNARDKANTETNGLGRLLKAINILLTVILNFIRYLLVNTNELLSRLDILLTNLQACEAVKDSSVISQLKQTQLDLIDLREQLALYVTQYDSKTNANNSMFGKYDIRVVDEEITDPSIRNKRRRGIALNMDRQIVAQSDLTFATNTAVIIAEVQQKLIALHLVPSNEGQINTADLATIADSVNFLDSNDVIDNDLNPDVGVLNEATVAQDVNITEFIDKLPGGPKFRQSSKAVTTAYGANAKQQVKTHASAISSSIK